ncbi:ATP-dependent DNA helicase RecG [Aquaspirillum sp. LM1]|uniref:ATP-dependent DNA helicase RecG n=1 Tax=Aquaspirillum sp. LM1 TaxID=1938604 RepID=UPI000983F0A1|nr:ATP-dependent DNA helicase RecG [Aquaspirillum sp. LM1]AQR65520.1 ATP-dependent DNA helicase RecG [Aquaspirillum sp. LM1]
MTASRLKVPPATAQKLARLGIQLPMDLVLHLPLRYEDETRITPIADAPYGQSVQVEGEVRQCEVQYQPRKQLLAQLADASGAIWLRFLHFYPSQQKLCAVGQRLRVVGELRSGFHGDEMVHPKVHSAKAEQALPEVMTPVYPTVQGLTQPVLRRLIAKALEVEDLRDTLPEALRQALALPDFADAVHTLHHPPPDCAQQALALRQLPAWQRLKFDELLAQQLAMRILYRQRRHGGAPVLHGDGQLRQALLTHLPFALTAAQLRVLAEIDTDLGSPHPMRRLLQGDVGSGKTVVAALAALTAIEAGYQAALMAPTEILAEQHYLKLRDWLTPLGLNVAWVSGSQKKTARSAARAAMASGDAHLTIGTHALFQDDIGFARLGLVIVDEQHRFGVSQRLALSGKGGEPHQLMMSATPIPRTLAMSYYADLDVSVIDELPPGRTPIVTKLINAARRSEVMGAVAGAVAKGQQAYWVCPLIEESETLQLQTAVDTHAELSAALPGIQVGLVHGRMKSSDKATVMAAFQRNEIQLLVATTVIEVGVDVANASLMVIEHAERMGLAQLHQLRGRVGRGAAESRCVLLFEAPLSELAKARLKVMYDSTDGFEIARQDLRLRGPGEFLGAKQSGTPMLRFADLDADQPLLDAARDWAPRLLAEQPEAVQAHLQRWLSGREQFLRG